jgi:cytochrome c oxidase subunit 2
LNDAGRWIVTAQPEGGALDPQGPVSEAMANLFWLMLGLGGAVFVAVVPSTAPPEALVIEVVGHQFWWEIRYPEQGVTVRDELHLPVDRPVNLQLTSADVIHSFWVPELAGKLDLLPDRTNTLVLEADQPGVHRSRCAEYCGLEHTRMVLTVVAESEERFAAWVAERRG